VAARAFVFDLDGTIWDSYPWLAGLIGNEDDAAVAAALANLRRQQPAATLLRAAGVTRASFLASCTDGAEGLVTYAGVEETLACLRKHGVALAVVTNLPSWMAEPMLRVLDFHGVFDSILGYAHFGKGRRIQQSLAAMGVVAGPDCWYVGDTQVDADAAAIAGVSFAWASYGYGLAVEGADAVLAQFADVLRL
jgi:phosphoglycolate phosphatase